MLQVIGDPIQHSKSPFIQTTMLRHLELDIPYTPQWVKKGEVAGYLAQAQAQGVTGFNATMPHKEALIPLMDQLGAEAVAYGAVNTVCRREGRWIGHNTDGDGCLSALVRAGMWPAAQVVLLGAGGAARAVALRLAQAGAERVWVCNRTVDRAQALCDLDPTGTLAPAAFDPQTLEELCGQAQLVINSTNLGMDDCPHQFDSFSFLDALPPQAGVMDLIYHPSRTQLLAQAQARGLNTCNGLPMLVYQAVFALEYFLDRPLPREELAEVVFQALEN